MIDLAIESSLTLSQAGRLLPPGRHGKTPSLGCLLRWVLDGCRSPSGEVVRLEALRVGGRWVTSREALQRFALALTPELGTSTVTSQRTTRQRQRASERAEKVLEKLGI